MRIIYTESFCRDYDKLPPALQAQIQKKIRLLSKNPRHPSLRTKKLEGTADIFEGHFTAGYCFTFQRKAQTLYLRRIGRHDIYKKP